MNLLLLQEHEITSQSGNRYCATIHEKEKLRHIRKVLKLQAGDSLRAGILNGQQGQATIREINRDSARLELEATEPPPGAALFTAMIALPRPPVFRRLLINLSSFGIKRMIFFQSERVEKSFWQSPVLDETNTHRLMIEGLEQGKDTILPELEFCRKFHLLPEHIDKQEEASQKIIFHPANAATSQTRDNRPHRLFCIGPEGGFTAKEVNWFGEQGFESRNLGSHILKVETAVFTALGTMIR